MNLIFFSFSHEVDDVMIFFSFFEYFHFHSGSTNKRNEFLQIKQFHYYKEHISTLYNNEIH